ncbi:MAG TPA: hypothetical protein VK742_00440 [Candidatus Sulfotelmatobacter sp.]|nr:hypothetical protein [Candidatus Sulfotelmatobacter sp.]
MNEESEVERRGAIRSGKAPTRGAVKNRSILIAGAIVNKTHFIVDNVYILGYVCGGENGFRFSGFGLFFDIAGEAGLNGKKAMARGARRWARGGLSRIDNPPARFEPY